MRAYVFVVMLCLSLANAEERPVSATEEKSLERAGLSHLSNEEKQKILSYARTIVARYITADGSSAASRFLENQGYKLVSAGVFDIRGSEHIVVDSGIVRWISKDVPIGLSSINMPEGKYWAKVSVLGVDEIIDRNGRVHRTGLYDWKELE